MPKPPHSAEPQVVPGEDLYQFQPLADFVLQEHAELGGEGRLVGSGRLVLPERWSHVIDILNHRPQFCDDFSP